MRTGSGWVTFAAVYLAVAGVMNMIWGVAALVDDDYFREDELLFSSLTLWGVIGLLVGTTQVLVGGLVYGRSRLGMGLGILIAVVAALLNFLTVGAYPVWSLTGVALALLIIWALTAHADEFLVE